MSSDHSGIGKDNSGGATTAPAAYPLAFLRIQRNHNQLSDNLPLAALAHLQQRVHVLGVRLAQEGRNVSRQHLHLIAGIVQRHQQRVNETRAWVLLPRGFQSLGAQNDVTQEQYPRIHGHARIFIQELVHAGGVFGVLFRCQHPLNGDFNALRNPL